MWRRPLSWAALFCFSCRTTLLHASKSFDYEYFGIIATFPYFTRNNFRFSWQSLPAKKCMFSIWCLLSSWSMEYEEISKKKKLLATEKEFFLTNISLVPQFHGLNFNFIISLLAFRVGLLELEKHFFCVNVTICLYGICRFQWSFPCSFFLVYHSWLSPLLIHCRSIVNMSSVYEHEEFSASCN